MPDFGCGMPGTALDWPYLRRSAAKRRAQATEADTRCQLWKFRERFGETGVGNELSRTLLWHDGSCDGDDRPS
jgi:hypothetical protein